MLETKIQEFRKKGIPQDELDQIKELSGDDPLVFQRYAHRRLFHEPLAYIAGTTKFYSREFKVDNRVYIPNHETEQLVKQVLAETRDNPFIIDVGTGCGSIAITIKKEKPRSRIYAVDISSCALDVARENARKHHADVQFFESYYVDDLPEIQPEIIVSDMPYGDKHYILPSIDIREFDHMPPQALFDMRGLLESYRELLSSIKKKKWHPTVFIETGKVQEDLVKEIIPEDTEYAYIPFSNYSITRIKL